MPVTTQDNRAKMVLDELLDKENRSSYLSDLWSDKGAALGKGHSLDIPELSDNLNAEDFIDASFNNVNLAATTAAGHTANNMVVDQARVISREIPTFDDMFTMGGSWLNAVSQQVLKSLKNDRDDKDVDYLIRTVAYDTAGTYHVNPGASAVTRGFIGEAIAKIMNGDGSPEFGDLCWMINPYMSESIKLLPGWTDFQNSPEPSRLGVKQIGMLNGIPVFVSQTIPIVLTTSGTGVTVSGGDAVFTVASGHGMVPGQKVYSTETAGGTTWDDAAGDDIPSTAPIAVSAVTATTVTVPYAGSGATDAGATITLTSDGCLNVLARKDRIFQSTMAGRFRTRIIPYGRERVSDVLQAYTIWGRLGIAGGAYVLHTPVDVTSA